MNHATIAVAGLFSIGRPALHAAFTTTVCLVLGGPATLFAQGTGTAAGFPSRPVRVVVPFTPGGQPDIFSRMIAQKVSEGLRQNVIVDNRPGAGGMLGSRIVAEAEPDGHTLLSISAAHAIGPSVRKLPYDTRKDFAGITMVYNTAYLLVVPPALGTKTAQELIALAKSHPSKLSYASGGIGGSGHLAMELFRAMTQVQVVHVPYKGNGPALADLMAG
ncbi:MAG: tripartite tricarboxylate transporter substrate-binding protein, partial [Pseudomonadota bacterium]